MSELAFNPKIATELLRDYGRTIAHMRQRHAVRRFGLVLGAGVSKEFGFPDWSEVLDRIGQHSEVQAPTLTTGKESPTYRSQILFQHYRAQKIREAGGYKQGSLLLECEIEVGWKKILHQSLYEKAQLDLSKLEQYYLYTFLAVIRESPLTITYNFDDSVERMLLKTRSDPQRRGYTTAWSANAQIEATQGVIYHPNGYLPHTLTEQPSDELIFLDETFADQLIASTWGYYSMLANHFAQTTCLFIGLSLNDPTLRYTLRRNARINPGHYHYYVSYVGNKDPRDPQRLEAEFDSNFKVHNLITLFLTSEKLAALGALLSMQASEYRARVQELGLSSSYRFFLVGPVGVGKTTALSNFRSLRTHEEWLDPLPEEMAVDPKELTSEQLTEIDRWVDDQLERKNSLLKTIESDVGGIDLIDRAPLDAFAFIPKEQWRVRAAEIALAIERSNPGRRLCEGHVILLTGDPEVIEPRAKRVMRSPTLEGLKKQDRILPKIYGPGGEDQGLSVIDTRGKSPAEVTNILAEVIYRKPYIPFNFQQRLVEIRDGSFLETD